MMGSRLFAIELYLFYALGVGTYLVYGNNLPSECHPTANPLLPHYLIGYGSLINTMSRKIDLPSVEYVYPIRAHGYQRSWNAVGRSSKGYNVTFLGAEENKNSSFNGILFHVPTNSTSTENMFQMLDNRENWYCRKQIPFSMINVLSTQPTELLQNASIWIYFTKPEFRGKANKTFPISLGYVDTFLEGCMEIENRFEWIGFSKECVTSTSDWGIYWFNNRDKSKSSLQAEKVDQLLKEDLENDMFEKIQFSSSQKSAESVLPFFLMMLFAIIIRVF